MIFIREIIWKHENIVNITQWPFLGRIRGEKAGMGENIPGGYKDK